MSTRLCILCEGRSEELVSNYVLKEYISTICKNVDMQTISLQGGLSVSSVSKKVRLCANNFDYVTTFIDFYGLAGKPPNPSKENVEEAILAGLTPHSAKKFIPYVQMYELEGLLFCDPIILSKVMGIEDSSCAD